MNPMDKRVTKTESSQSLFFYIPLSSGGTLRGALICCNSTPYIFLSPL